MAIPLFFLSHTTLQQRPKALVGFKPRTEPGLSTRHSNSTSASYVIMHALLLYVVELVNTIYGEYSLRLAGPSIWST